MLDTGQLLFPVTLVDVLPVSVTGVCLGILFEVCFILNRSPQSL